MKKQYDTIIIGAGPAGLFCAYELKNKGYKDVLVFDMGDDFDDKKCSHIDRGFCEDCNTCSMLSGAGGAAFFNPGKLSLYPAGSNLVELLGDEERCKKLYDNVSKIFLEFGLRLKSDDVIGAFSDLGSGTLSKDIEFKYYTSYPIDKKTFNSFFKSFHNNILADINIEYGCRVEEIERNFNGSYTVIAKRKNKETIEIVSQNVVVAIGEIGARWWKAVQKKLEIAHEKSSVDIGIRIELPSSFLENTWKTHKDAKLIFPASDGSELRTYCTIKNGKTVICNLGDYKLLDGIEFENSDVGGMTIFNRIFCDDHECMIEYVFSLLEKMKTKTGNPIYSIMGQFLQTAERDIQSTPLVKTLKHSVAHDIDTILPKSISDNLKYAIVKLEAIIPGISDANNIIYYPLVDKLWNPSEISNTMETNIKGIYVCGDACGHLRGIMQACVTGLLCAEGIAKEGSK